MEYEINRNSGISFSLRASSRELHSVEFICLFALADETLTQWRNAGDAENAVPKAKSESALHQFAYCIFYQLISGYHRH